jgi:hypothetical protein
MGGKIIWVIAFLLFLKKLGAIELGDRLNFIPKKMGE